MVRTRDLHVPLAAGTLNIRNPSDKYLSIKNFSDKRQKHLQFHHQTVEGVD